MGREQLAPPGEAVLPQGQQRRLIDARAGRAELLNTGSPMDAKTREYGALTLYRRLVAEARPYWPHTLAYLLLSLLATPLALLAPLPLKIAVDSVIGSS